MPVRPKLAPSAPRPAWAAACVAVYCGIAAGSANYVAALDKTRQARAQAQSDKSRAPIDTRGVISMTGHVSTLLLSGVARLFLFLITTARDGVEERDVRRCTVDVAMITSQI